MKEVSVPTVTLGLGETACRGADAVTDDGTKVVLLQLCTNNGTKENAQCGLPIVNIECYSVEGIDVLMDWLQTAKEELMSRTSSGYLL